MCGLAVAIRNHPLWIEPSALLVIFHVDDDALLLGELGALLVAGAEWAVGLILTERRHGVSLEKH